MSVISHIRTLTDFKAVPVEWSVSLRCPEEHLHKELRQVVRKHKQVVDVVTLEPGDVALLKLESTFPKFNKAALPVTVGSNLFHSELERQCLGHGPGDRFFAETEQASVTVTVLKASRTLYPQPTDEMVAQFCQGVEAYEGITTVEDFLEKARKDWQTQKRADSVYEKMNDLMEAVLTTSDWEFAEEDLQLLRQQNLQQLQQELNKPIESLTPQELRLQFGVEDMDALCAEIDLGSERWIACILWCAALAGRQPSFEDMETLDFDFLEAYVRSRIVYEEETR